jgi:putative transposase
MSVLIMHYCSNSLLLIIFFRGIIVERSIHECLLIFSSFFTEKRCNNEKIFPIEKMCKVLPVGQRSYYQWKSQSVSDRKQRVVLVKEKITSIYFESKQRYGSPRMTVELASLGSKVSRITVAKYMNQLSLRSKLSKKFKVTTNSKYNHLIMPNVLNREFSVT